MKLHMNCLIFIFTDSFVLNSSKYSNIQIFNILLTDIQSDVSPKKNRDIQNKKTRIFYLNELQLDEFDQEVTVHRRNELL
jgi:hypothetical protein